MTPWMDTIDKLRSLGYRIVLDRKNLKYAYRGKGNPLSRDEITPLLEALKNHKGEILNDPWFLIEQTLQRINEGWKPGALEWVERERPEKWIEIRRMEEDINRAVLSGDVSGLKDTLSHYCDLWDRIILDFQENLIPSQTKESIKGTEEADEATAIQRRLFR